MSSVPRVSVQNCEAMYPFFVRTLRLHIILYIRRLSHVCHRKHVALAFICNPSSLILEVIPPLYIYIYIFEPVFNTRGVFVVGPDSLLGGWGGGGGGGIQQDPLEI